MPQVKVVIRRAKPADAASRGAIIRAGAFEHNGTALAAFLMSELTLQCVVLCGAVMFIFMNVSVTSLLLLPPVVAAAVYLMVVITHQTIADKHVQSMQREEAGFVAELHAPLLVDPRRCHVEITLKHQNDDTKPEYEKQTHTQVIGTVSVSEWQGSRHSGFLHSLAVHKDWSGRGVGRALLSAVINYGTDAGLASVEAVTSELQHRANDLFYKAGWESRGSYHRRLCGAALTLMLTHYGKDLPYA